MHSRRLAYERRRRVYTTTSSVIHGHIAVTELFLDALKMDNRAGLETKDDEHANIFNDLLVIALRYQHDGLVHLLFSSQFIANSHSKYGESVLHAAVWVGRSDYVELFLNNMAAPETYIDTRETARGWTPLMVACVTGQLETAKMLLHAGAKQEALDQRGWTAKEHATFRGHHLISKLFEACENLDPFGGPGNASPRNSGLKAARVDTETLLAINLGSMQSNRQVTAVALNCCSSIVGKTPHAETQFSIEVSIPGSTSHLLQLPILDDASRPLLLSVGTSNVTQVTFKIFRDGSVHGEKGNLIGSGTALLEDTYSCCVPRRESLRRTRSVSILSRETLEFMGVVSFTFVIARSFPGAVPHPTPRTIIKTANSVHLVGHRGEFGPYTTTGWLDGTDSN